MRVEGRQTRETRQGKWLPGQAFNLALISDLLPLTAREPILYICVFIHDKIQLDFGNYSPSTVILLSDNVSNSS